MSKFQMDLSKFRKVAADDKSTTLRHEDGHEMRIAHSALSPKVRGQLAALPEAMAEGGTPSPKPSDSSPPNIDPVKAKQFEKGFNSGDVSIGKAIDNAKKALGFAEGGSINKSANQQMKDLLEEEDQKYAAPKPTPSASPTQNYDDGGMVELAEKLAPFMMAAMSKGGSVHFKPQHIPNYSKNIPHFADGGQANSSSLTDSPEQIASDAAAAPPQQEAVPAVDPELQAKRAAYNQLVQANMVGKSGLSQGGNESDMSSAQFGPNGEPPANFNPQLWTQADNGYKQSQQAELASKQQATAKMATDNQARISAGLDPIPITSDQAASEVPQTRSNNDVPATPQTPADPAIPGDAELKQAQNNQQAVSSAIPRSPASAPGQSPQDTAQKLVAAKQLTFDALMHERQQMISQMKNADPNTLGKMFDDKSWHGKLGMIAGLMLGGASSAVLGQENNVTKMYESMIDNNLKAQQLNMNQKQNLLANNMQMTGNVKDAIALSKLQTNDLMMHKLVQLAAKYPNNPQIQQNLQAMGMMGMQSSSNIMDTLAANQAWRHAASQISDPLQRIQFNPVLTPEQKNAAIKEYGEYQNLSSLRDDTLHAFDKVAKLNTLGNRISSPIQTPRQIQELRDITLDKLTKDTSGRVTPETVSLVGSVFARMADNKVTVAQGRDQLARILSQNMHFPHLQLAGVDVSAPVPGNIQSGPPKLGK